MCQLFSQLLCKGLSDTQASPPFLSGFMLEHSTASQSVFTCLFNSHTVYVCHTYTHKRTHSSLQSMPLRPNRLASFTYSTWLHKQCSRGLHKRVHLSSSLSITPAPQSGLGCKGKASLYMNIQQGNPTFPMQCGEAQGKRWFWFEEGFGHVKHKR